MPIKLDDDRRAEISASLQSYFSSEFDEILSEFRANEIVDFMLSKIGPSQYNQGIKDAHAYIASKLDDLDTDFHEPEDR